MSVAAQMNVRIDPDLKKRGDRVFAKRGLSPSQAVRAFYESVVGTKERSDEVLDAVLGHGARQDGVDAERERKLESIRKAQAYVHAMARSVGDAGTIGVPAAADEEALEEAIFEHYAQKEMVG